MRVLVLDPPEPTGALTLPTTTIDDSPAGLVWRTQKPLIRRAVELKHWSGAMQRVASQAAERVCELPLTTQQRRLGTIMFACADPAAYKESDFPFLRLLANHVAVAVENALAFQELAALKDRLAQEKAYLEEEVRTDQFGDMVAVSTALRAALRKVKT